MENKKEKIGKLAAMVEKMTEEQFKWFTDQVLRALSCKDGQLSHQGESK